MNYRTGLLIFLSLLLLGGASLASATQVSPSYLTGIPAMTPSQGTSHITAGATTISTPSVINAPLLTGFVPAPGSRVAPIQGGDFREFVNPYWSVANADETYSGSVIATCPL